MARSESGSQSFIQAQRQRLMELGEYGEDMGQGAEPPANPPAPPAPPVPPVDPSVPPQDSPAPVPPVPPVIPPAPETPPPPAEPPAPPAPVDSSQAPPSPQPSDLGQILAQIEDLRHRLESSEGRLAPIQRQLAAALEENEKLKGQLAGQPPARGTQPPAPQPPAPPEQDDPDLEQFGPDGVYGDMTPGLNKLIVKAVKDTLAPIQAQIAPVVDMAASQRQAEDLRVLRQTHLAPVFEKHPDAYNVVSSPDFKVFINRLPSYVSTSVEEMFLHPENHPQERLIAVLDDYKKSRNQPVPPVPPPPPVPDPATLAGGPRRIVSAPQPPPTAPVPITRERVAQLNRALTYERSLYSPEQISAFKAELDQGEMVAIAAGRGAVPTLDTMR